MIARYIWFFGMLLAVLALGHLVIGLRLIGSRAWSPRNKRWAWFGLALFAAMPFLTQLGRRSDLPGWLESPVTWIGYGTLGASTLLFVAALLGEPLRWAEALAWRAGRGDPLADEACSLDRRGLLRRGVTDWRRGASHPGHTPDLAATLSGAPSNLPKILLAHPPRHVNEAAAAGVALQLRGHTHGGQFVLFSWFVLLQQPYTAGLHRHGDTWIYVSRGAGYWGPPLRLGIPSEVTLLRLRSPQRLAWMKNRGHVPRGIAWIG